MGVIRLNDFYETRDGVITLSDRDADAAELHARATVRAEHPGLNERLYCDYFDALVLAARGPAAIAAREAADREAEVEADARLARGEAALHAARIASASGRIPGRE